MAQSGEDVAVEERVFHLIIKTSLRERGENKDKEKRNHSGNKYNCGDKLLRSGRKSCSEKCL